MFGAQWLLLCLVDADDAPRLLAVLTAAGCGAAEQCGQGYRPTQGRVGVLVVATPGAISLVLATARRTCGRRVAGRASPALAVVLNPLAEEGGGASILALPVRNSARWALGDLPIARSAQGRWEMHDAALLEAEALSLASARPTKLLVVVVPDQAAGRVLAALTRQRLPGPVVGSTGGYFRCGTTTIVADVPAEQAQLAAEEELGELVAGAQGQAWRCRASMAV
jgi:uncharacterized protein YaaQ